MFRALILSLILWSASPAAYAQANSDLDDIVQIRLIPGWQMPSGAYMGALQVTLAPGWKTYWRVGGDTGIPPRFDWAKSDNLAATNLRWPRPRILAVDDIEVLGYEGEFILPIEFSPTDSGEKIVARADIQLGVCRDICIPVQLSVALDFDNIAQTERSLIETALGDGAVSASNVGISPPVCRLEPVEDGYRVSAEILLPADFPTPKTVVFESQNPDIWVTGSATEHGLNRLVSDALFLSFEETPLVISGPDIRITLISENQAVDIQGCTIR